MFEFLQAVRRVGLSRTVGVRKLVGRPRLDARDLGRRDLRGLHGDPCILVYFLLKRKDIPFVPVFWLFGAFIFFCGLSHVSDAVIFWFPRYRFSGTVKLLTAVVSWVTVVSLISVVPKAMEIPGVLEAKYRAALEASPAAMLMTDGRGTITIANGETKRLFGYDHGDLVGQPIDVLVPALAEEASFSSGEGTVRTVRVLGEAGGVNGVRRDGSSVPLEIGLNPFRVAGRDQILVAMMDMTSQRQAEEELRNANEALVANNAELQQFAHVASHDLQTPLRAIAGFTQVIERKYAGDLPEDGAKYLHRISENTRRMKTLIDDLLRFSRIDSQSEIFAPVDMNEVFEDALSMLEAPITERAAVVIADQLPTLIGDRSQLLQLFQNLIGNGIKYNTSSIPEIRVLADDTEESWKIGVRDNGIGIDPIYQERVFEIFKRLHSETEYPGTGIGLAICRRIVERHGGEISLESAEGAGATFWIILPKVLPEEDLLT